MQYHGRRPRHLFTAKEDEIITRLVNENGERGWKHIAQHLENRTARQVRERWVNYLSPWVNKGIWTESDDALLEKLEVEYNRKWCKIVRFFPNRTDVMLKNRSALIHRQIKRGKRVSSLQKKPPNESQYSKEDVVPLFEEEISITGFDIFNHWEDTCESDPMI